MTAVHKGNMTAWNDIACQRECERHWTRPVEIALGGPTRYQDFTPIPNEYATSFSMLVWDPGEHPVDGGPYCPAHDAVSETIVSHGVWEPRETTCALWAFHNRPGVFVDMGAQIGWYTILAALSDRHVIAYEPDADNRSILAGSLVDANLENMVQVFPDRIGPTTDEIVPVEISLAKLDLEGAEDQGIRILWPSIREGMVHSILMEVSPVFDDYYPGLVNRIINQGYDSYLIPPKHSPPFTIDGSPTSLERWRFSHLAPAEVAILVSSWHQEDVLFVRSS